MIGSVYNILHTLYHFVIILRVKMSRGFMKIEMFQPQQCKYAALVWLSMTQLVTIVFKALCTIL